MLKIFVTNDKKNTLKELTTTFPNTMIYNKAHFKGDKAYLLEEELLSSIRSSDSDIIINDFISDYEIQIMLFSISKNHEVSIILSHKQLSKISDFLKKYALVVNHNPVLTA